MKTLPYNYNRKLGYYKMGKNEYDSKISALLDSAATPNAPHIEFDFNNKFFDCVNWKKEPSEELSELYKQRALQLREKYDYIIVSYTGGADSWTVLNSFLSNGISVDEIVTTAPIQATKNKKASSTNFDLENYWSEFYLITKPDLENISKKFPKIKITIHDWTEDLDLDSSKMPKDWQLSRSGSLSPLSQKRVNLHLMTDSVHKYKNVCDIQGYDKPRICIKDNKYYLYFLDFIHKITVGNLGYLDNWTTEFFYWAPESEKILRKQSHTIKRFFETNPAFKSYIQWPISNPNNRTFYENLVKGLIYPHYDLSRFQTNKMKKMWMNPVWDIIYFDKNLKVFSDWAGGISDLGKEIEEKYWNGDDITGFVSGFYEI